MEVGEVVRKMNGVKGVEGVGVEDVVYRQAVSIGSRVKKNYEYWKLKLVVGLVPVHEGEEDSK